MLGSDSPAPIKKRIDFRSILLFFILLNSDLSAMTNNIISGTKDVAIGGGTVTTIPITVPAGKWLLFAEMTLPPGLTGYASFGFDSSTASTTIGGSVTGVANSLVWMGNNAIGFTNNNTTGDKTVILNVWASVAFTGSFKYFGIKLP